MPICTTRNRPQGSHTDLPYGGRETRPRHSLHHMPASDGACRKKSARANMPYGHRKACPPNTRDHMPPGPRGTRGTLHSTDLQNGRKERNDFRATNSLSQSTGQIHCPEATDHPHSRSRGATLQRLRHDSKITSVFWRSAAMAASVRLHRRISNMPASPSCAALSSSRQNTQFIFEPSLRALLLTIALV